MTSAADVLHDMHEEVGDTEEENVNEATRNEPVAPDGGWGWMVVLGSFIIYLIADGCVYSFGVFYNELLDYFGESKGKTAIIPAMLYGFPLILSPFVCALVNSFGCRMIGMVGGILVGLGFLVSNFATSVTFLIVSLGVCCSLGLQMSYIAAIMIVTYYFDARRGLATGLAVAGSGIGTFAFAPVFEALIETYAWRGASLIIASICFNILTASCLFRPSPTEPYYRNDQEMDDTETCSPVIPQKEVKKESIPMVQLQLPEEDVGPTEQEPLVLSESKIVLVSLAGSECENSSTQGSCRSIQGSTNFSKGTCSDVTLESMPKDSSVTLHSESEPQPTTEIWRKQHDNYLLAVTANDQRPVGQVVSKSAELLNIPGGAYDKKLHHSHSDQRLHRGARDRSASLQDIHFHRGGSPIFFSSRASLKYTPSFRRSKPDETRMVRDASSFFVDELKEAVTSMFDPSLLKQTGFLLICLSNFMLCLWFGAPYVYIIDKATSHGIDPFHASFLVSIMGITSTIGQVVLGYTGDVLKNCIFIYEVSMVLCGISTILIPACSSFWSHCVIVGVFGFFISANYSLTTLILIQVVGLDRLTTAFGFLQLGQGIGTILGTPLVGLVFDHTGSYNIAFYIAGVWICLSGIVLLPLHWLVRDESCLHRKPKAEDTLYEEVAL